MSPFTADVKGDPDGKLDGERIISDEFTSVGRWVMMVNQKSEYVYIMMDNDG